MSGGVRERLQRVIGRMPPGARRDVGRCRVERVESLFVVTLEDDGEALRTDPEVPSVAAQWILDLHKDLGVDVETLQ